MGTLPTTRGLIQTWIDTGKRAGKAYMAVWCDSYDYDDYPKYYDDAASCQESINTSGQNMQTVIEVYDLLADTGPQLAAWRAWALRPKVKGDHN